MIFIKNGTINTITNGIIKGDILVENKKQRYSSHKRNYIVVFYLYY